jgi:hypothetical protein
MRLRVITTTRSASCSDYLTLYFVVRYKEAVAAYEAARDYDNAVRLYLDKLNDPENAVRIVKLTKRYRYRQSS